MSSRKCVYPNCNPEKLKHEEHLFSFPDFFEEGDRRRRWLANSGLAELDLKDGSCLCWKHFEPQFLIRRTKQFRLRSNAVPISVINGIGGFFKSAKDYFVRGKRKNDSRDFADQNDCNETGATKRFKNGSVDGAFRNMATATTAPEDIFDGTTTTSFCDISDDESDIEILEEIPKTPWTRNLNRESDIQIIGEFSRRRPTAHNRSTSDVSRDDLRLFQTKSKAIDLNVRDQYAELLKHAQVLVASDGASFVDDVCPTTSNSYSSPNRSRSSDIKRCTSFEKLDELFGRSQLSSLNEKFKSVDPTSLKSELENSVNAKGRRSEMVRKLAIEAKMRREERTKFQESHEETVRLRTRFGGLLIEEKEIKEDVEFIELTAEQQSVVDKATERGFDDEILVDAFNLQITRHDLKSLKGLNWLNDAVINFFFNMIMDRGGKDDKPKVYVTSTFFYPKLMQGGHAALKRWTKKVDIFGYDLMLIPVHLGIHWCLSVVDFRKKTISYFDSMGGGNDEGLCSLLRYLQDESMDKKKEKMDTTGWELNYAPDIPRQMNGSDCGMFACRFAEYASRDAEVNFTQDHMPYFRNRTIYEILNKRLL